MRFESCDSKAVLSINRMHLGWRFRVDFPRFYFTAIRLIVLLLAAEFPAIPSPRFWESCDSRLAQTSMTHRVLEKQTTKLRAEKVSVDFWPLFWGLELTCAWLKQKC